MPSQQHVKKQIKTLEQKLAKKFKELIEGIPQIGCFRNFKDQITEFTTTF